MKGKLVKDISSSTIQVIINQGLGLLIFVIISRYLDKSLYGELNWSLAILTFIITLLSLRLEQVVVQKIAAGENTSKILSLFFGHVLLSGVLFYSVLLAGSFLFPSFFRQHNLILILAVSQLLSFFSLPFKQLANGKENFGWLALMSSVANVIRALGLLWAVIFATLTMREVLLIYIISSFAEFGISYWVAGIKIGTRIRMQWTITDYCILIKESLPQIGVVFLNACIARIDWILLGFFSTQVITAEYSFAYKMFELSPLPLLIIAPVLLSRFSKYFSSHTEFSLQERNVELDFLIRTEMILATMIPLIANMVWSPLIDMLTNHKYGAINKTTFLILSFCIPLQYLINLFWTIHFSLKHLALIFRITAITCAIIVAGDLLLIPLMNAKGAALVYLAAITIECLIYLRVSAFASFRNTLMPMVLCTGIALISGLLAYQLNVPVAAKLFLSLLLYSVLIILTGQVRRADLQLLKQKLSGYSFKSVEK
jgi:O-antigen/teichoic acid export membrane protein